MEKRLYRSRSDRVISGVCGGLADYFEIDPTLVRAAAVVLGLVTHGGILIAYIIMAVVVPEEEGFTVIANDTHQSSQLSEQTPPPPAAPPEPQYAAPVAPKPGQPRAHGTRGLWWGLALIVVGMILLADQFLPGVGLWQYWPLIIVAIGLATVIRGVRR